MFMPPLRALNDDAPRHSANLISLPLNLLNCISRKARRSCPTIHFISELTANNYENPLGSLFVCELGVRNCLGIQFDLPKFLITNPNIGSFDLNN